MGYDLNDIDGIEPPIRQKLLAASISTTEDLLDLCADEHGRARVSSHTGLNPLELLGWTRLADLTRLTGVDPTTAELIEAAGVCSVEAMKRQNAVDLAEHLKQVNAEYCIARTTPAASVIQRWIEEAAVLPPRTVR